MLEEAAITMGAAAKLMNIFLDESPSGLITDVLIEEDEDATILILFKHERGEDISFQIHPEVFAMANAGEFADLFLRTAYGIGFEMEFDETQN